VGLETGDRQPHGPDAEAFRPNFSKAAGSANARQIFCRVGLPFRVWPASIGFGPHVRDDLTGAEITTPDEGWRFGDDTLLVS